ncbi:YlbL family protein [Marisediminicola senii]|uniref:YlbL family protein n=1 Tax=Marisediminicola senii TaxID=2711233 RepID=UPI0013EDBEC6|nr:S16 family serine protease [Marisediminicola senii]
MTLLGGAGPSARLPKRRRVGWIILSSGLVAVLGLGLLPSPYVIQRPGPVFDTLGDVVVDDVEEPLIDIPGETTYPTEGSLSLLTVNVVGNRESPPPWFEIVTSWVDPSRAVVPVDAVYPEGETVEQSQERSAVDMENSQKDAVAASLGQLDYDLDSTLTVAEVPDGTPAEGIVEAGDVIVDVDGQQPVDVTQLRSIIADNGTGQPVALTVLRGGAELALEVTPVLADGEGSPPVVGISVATEYDFPFEVEIRLEQVGGPSAGMMFALGIIDKLTPGSLAGGADVAGTGTITADGTVGGIGGIRQKLYGAVDAGATEFLAPSANCDEVVGHIPDGLDVYAISTLDDAVTVLETIASDGDLSALPVCTVTGE